jgi:hypothetical protein
MAQTIDPNKLDFQWRTYVSSPDNQKNTYSLRMGYDGQSFDFIPESVINTGVNNGNNTSFFTYFLNRDNLNNFFKNAIPVDLGNVSWYGDYLTNKVGASTKGYLVPAGFDIGSPNTVSNDSTGGGITGIGQKGDELVYGTKLGGDVSGYLDSSGNFTKTTINRGGGGLFGGFLGNLVNPVIGAASDFLSSPVGQIASLYFGGNALLDALGGAEAIGGVLGPDNIDIGGGFNPATTPPPPSITPLPPLETTTTSGSGLPTITPPPPAYGQLGSGTFAPAGDLGTEFVTQGGLGGTGALANLGATDASLGAAGALNALPAESPFLAGMTGVNAVEGAGVAGTGLGSGIGGMGLLSNLANTPVSTIAKSLLGKLLGGTLADNTYAQLLQGGLGTAGGLMQTQASKEAAQQAIQDIARATQQATTGAQFRPVGITTRFGTSQFQIDPTTGQVVGAGYTTAPEITSAQNQLMKLGAGYLAQSPQDVAKQYLAQQYELLDPIRQRQLAEIRNQAFQTGRGGLSVGSTGLRPSGAQGLMGANPELEAYYNAIAQQNAQLAAQAQQAGQQQVGFGTGLFGQAGQLEQLAQQPFTLGTDIGKLIAGAGGTAGRLGLAGAGLGAQYATSPEATTNIGSQFLQGISSPTSTLGQGLFNWLTSNAPNITAPTLGLGSPTLEDYANLPVAYQF